MEFGERVCLEERVERGEVKGWIFGPFGDISCGQWCG